MRNLLSFGFLSFLSFASPAFAQHFNGSRAEALAVPEDKGDGWRKLTFEDSEGKTFRFADLEGKIVLLDFFFTSCGAVCPAQTASLRTLLNSLDAETKKNVALVSISVDPANDTKERLQSYRYRFAIKANSPWTFARGSAESTKAITEYFGGVEEKNPLNHRNQLYVLGPSGLSLLSYRTIPVIDTQRLKTDMTAFVDVFIRKAKKS